MQVNKETRCKKACLTPYFCGKTTKKHGGILSLLTKRTDTATARVVDAIATGDIVPLYNQEILEEYDDVLHRAKFSFSEKNIKRILAMIRGLGLPVNLSPTGQMGEKNYVSCCINELLLRVVFETDL